MRILATLALLAAIVCGAAYEASARTCTTYHYGNSSQTYCY